MTELNVKQMQTVIITAQEDSTYCDGLDWDEFRVFSEEVLHDWTDEQVVNYYQSIWG